jgi:hypothetical protein
MVRFGNSFVIFTTSKKNSNEIKDVLVKNFGLNLSVPKGNTIFANRREDQDDLTDEDDAEDNSGEKHPLIETRDSVPPLSQHNTSGYLKRRRDSIETPRGRRGF